VRSLSLESFPKFIGIYLRAALSTSGKAEDFPEKYL
jgi:hypothetical protein